MKKTYLLTPGPTPIPESVSAIFSKPIIHHRTPAFEFVFQDVRQGLKYLYQTKQDVLLLTATGTGAMDAAVSNLFNRGEKVISLNAGKFGERWTKIAKAYELNVVEIKVPAGESVEARQVEKAIQENSDAKGILFQASETSTGVVMPTQEICRLAESRRNALDLRRDHRLRRFRPSDGRLGNRRADYRLPESSHDPARPRDDRSQRPRLGRQRKFEIFRAFTSISRANERTFAKNQTAWTPAISLVQGLQESLRLIREEGLHNVFKRHDLLARATRNAVQALGPRTSRQKISVECSNGS